MPSPYQSNPHPLVSMSPQISLRKFIENTSAVLPPWWAESDEDLVCRNVAKQLGQEHLLPFMECDVTDLWKYISRS
jgi:hypothetical protein